MGSSGVVRKPVTGRVLQPGDQLPDLEGRTLDGRLMRYRDIWQKNLVVVVTLPVRSPREAERYRQELSRRSLEFTVHETTVIIRDADPHIPPTAEPGATHPSTGRGCVPRTIPGPSVIIADRWGEVRSIDGLEGRSLPPVDEIIEWVWFMQMECPECQGETR